MDSGQRTRRRIVIGGCLFIGIGLVAIGVTLFVLLRPEGPSLRELRAKHGDIAAKAQAIVDAHKSAQDKALQEARAKAPPNSPVPADWSMDVALKQAWLPMDQKVLSDLADISRGPEWDHPYKLENHWNDLEERLLLARQAGKATTMEARFDPNTLGRAGTLDAFREYVLNDAALGQFEAAIALGLYPQPDESTSDEERNDCHARRRLAIDLLACKARALAASGKQEPALRIALGLFKVDAAANENMESSRFVYFSLHAPPACGLQSILAQGAISTEWQRLFIEQATRFADKETLRDRLRLCAAHDPLASMILGNAGLSRVAGKSTTLSALRAYDVAEQLCALLDRPSSEWAPSLQEIRARFHRDNEAGHRGVFKMISVATQGIDSMFLPLVLEDLLRLFQSHARAALWPDMLKVAFALEDARAETGHYPPTLDVLVPAKIEAIPMDPLTQTPILYEQDERGYAFKLPSSSLDWLGANKKGQNVVAVNLSNDTKGLDVVWQVTREEATPASRSFCK